MIGRAGVPNKILMTIELSTPLSQLPTVGPRTERLLIKLGLRTARDLLFYYPFRYDDFSQVSKISNLQIDVTATIKARVDLIKNWRSPRKRMILTEAILSDDSGLIKAIWFRQPFLIKLIKPGDELFLSGKVEKELLNFQLINPTYEKVKSIPLHTARLVPIYPTTARLTQKQIRYLVKLSQAALPKINDWLPLTIIARQKLIDLKTALRQIHFPAKESILQRARFRLKFDELFLIQLGALRIKEELKKEKAPLIGFKENETKKFVESLPFLLTQAQRKAAWEILKDLEKANPMNRLLEGDVGSGKTVVAAIAIFNTALNKFQSAIMAPTEILAQQHFVTLKKLFSQSKIKIGLLTSSAVRLTGKKEIKKKELLEKNEDGKIDILVGTHALIQKDVRFKNLGLVTIDEQHRFGVEQRKKLKEINLSSTDWIPHLLSMTATPIPRSLALTVYGDLDLSVLDEMPPGRKRVFTKVVPPEKRIKAYQFIRMEIKKGRQVFVICPLIEESDKLGVKAVTTEYKKLSKEIFPDLKIGILHGKIKAKEKEQVMQDFLKGKLDILVSTAVVEVGIDVPNATIMMIEGSERFGLAQLHQFRGRVGRGEHQSYCFLFTEHSGATVNQRLNALVKSHNGFYLAEQDLKFRGPGEVYGSRQSGFLPNLRIARLTDYGLIKTTRLEAENLLKDSPELAKYPILKRKMANFTESVHLE